MNRIKLMLSTAAVAIVMSMTAGTASANDSQISKIIQEGFGFVVNKQAGSVFTSDRAADPLFDRLQAQYKLENLKIMNELKNMDTAEVYDNIIKYIKEIEHRISFSNVTLFEYHDFKNKDFSYSYFEYINGIFNAYVASGSLNIINELGTIITLFDSSHVNQTYDRVKERCDYIAKNKIVNNEVPFFIFGTKRYQLNDYTSQRLSRSLEKCEGFTFDQALGDDVKYMEHLNYQANFKLKLKNLKSVSDIDDKKFYLEFLSRDTNKILLDLVKYKVNGGKLTMMQRISQP